MPVECLTISVLFANVGHKTEEIMNAIVGDFKDFGLDVTVSHDNASNIVRCVLGRTIPNVDVMPSD